MYNIFLILMLLLTSNINIYAAANNNYYENFVESNLDDEDELDEKKHNEKPKTLLEKIKEYWRSSPKWKQIAIGMLTFAVLGGIGDSLKMKHENFKLQTTINNDYYKSALHKGLLQSYKKIENLQTIANQRSNYFALAFNDILLQSFSIIYHEVGHLILHLMNNQGHKPSWLTSKTKIVLPNNFSGESYMSVFTNSHIHPGAHKEAGGYVKGTSVGLSNFSKDLKIDVAGYMSQNILHKIYTNNPNIENEKQQICEHDKNKRGDYFNILDKMRTNNCNVEKINKTIDNTTEILKNIHSAHLLYAFYIWNSSNVDKSGKLPKIMMKSLYPKKIIEEKYNILPEQTIDVIHARNKKAQPIKYAVKKSVYINQSFNPFTNLDDLEHLITVTKEIVAHQRKHYQLLSTQQKQVLDLAENALKEDNLNVTKNFINKNKEKYNTLKQLKEIEKEVYLKTNDIINENIQKEKKIYKKISASMYHLMETLTDKKKQSPHIKQLYSYFLQYENKVIINVLNKQIEKIKKINSHKIDSKNVIDIQNKIKHARQWLDWSKRHLDQVIIAEKKGMKEYTVYFPLYSLEKNINELNNILTILEKKIKR